jgi:putative PIN family toxin of toxin-antitoxin system
MKNRKIILDTNLWISFLISKNFTEIDELVQEKNITLIFSNESLEEFIEVVKRPKFEKFFSRKDIEKLLDIFDQYAELIKVKSKMNICRDPKDNFLLNLAVDGKVDYLITGDKDLLVLEKIEKTQIITYQNLIEKTSSD